LNGPTSLYLARHGESRANIEGVLSHRAGQHSLTDRGRRQARALAEWLAREQISAIYSSPLHRALETASTVSERVGPGILTREQLREVNVGDLDGRSDDEAWTIYHSVVGRWRSGDAAARFPGGEDYREAESRLISVLGEIMSGPPRPRVAVISHGEILTQVLSRLVDLPVGTPAALDVAAVIVLEREGVVWRCLRWNSTEHLVSVPDAGESPLRA
jgi:probable phosphoglycerate mutase